ncbi:MAG TPA: uroporphyrinogen decarboxylase [Caulobacteraceae bacterium]|jgi:uroporphyrinogen decarboxylase|nr:uroporphyrinogen decarboxylase [Caulobacteraceae bacterium]
MTSSRPLFLRAIDREPVERPPIWFMRQAGRCLPEYRALRASVKSTKGMLALCADPQIAAEVTLQPMRRFAYDAAIVFADIFVLTLALGQDVWFETGEGPRLEAMPSLDAMRDAITAVPESLAYVGETLRRVRAELEPERALIGFAGGPWTLATYMLVGFGGVEGRAKAKAMALAEPARVEALVDLLAEATIPYLAMQAGAGAQALQIFESWAESLPEPALFERLVIRPHARIVEGLRALGVTAPVIGFPREAALGLIEPYVEATGVQAISLGTATPLEFGRTLQSRVAIQGALDPDLLRAGGPAMTKRIDELLEAWSGGPYVFNLGHGVHLDTPIENIAVAVAQVTAWRNG